MTGVLIVQSFNSGTWPYQFDSTWTYLEMLAAALINMVGMNLMTIANQRANPSRVSLLSYLGVGYNFLVDLFIFQ